MSQISKELLSELQEAKQTMQAVQNELGLMAIAESTKPELLARYKEMQAQIRKASEKLLRPPKLAVFFFTIFVIIT